MQKVHDLMMNQQPHLTPLIKWVKLLTMLKVMLLNYITALHFMLLNITALHFMLLSNQQKNVIKFLKLIRTYATHFYNNTRFNFLMWLLDVKDDFIKQMIDSSNSIRQNPPKVV